MFKALKIATAAAAIVVLAASVSNAGLNAGGTAQLYWQHGTAAPIAARDETVLTPQLLVTAKGLNNFRGADVQLLVNGSNGTLPLDWDYSSTGCNGGNATFYVGGRINASNAFTVTPAVSGVVATQDGMVYDPAGAISPCITPHGVALLWLSAAGANGAARTAATEYGIWAIKFDLATNQGACDPNGPLGLCINPNERIPCGDLQRGAVIAVVDGNTAIDYLPFASGKIYLTWSAAGATWCPGVTPTTKTSWGSLKKIYR
jgi:hypothetical protein